MCSVSSSPIVTDNLIRKWPDGVAVAVAVNVTAANIIWKSSIYYSSVDEIQHRGMIVPDQTVDTMGRL